ncbi:unnamed protein product [Rotaria sp. Silwood1]|nr:unnamed protein product [Rotaria sp. Silwood1]CAF4702472.1 unnamed protein product [Rotaria sp. Silwood1]CAF4832926.1 unnamed protein product [Rotaria sp. Silwood1]
MGTTYDYTYEYEVTDKNRHHRTTGGNAEHYTQRAVGHQPHYGVSLPHASRTDMMDSLANLQHDRIWHKLYDPLDMHKATHETEIQKMARRQDRKVIKIEAAYGSDRQTFIVKRNYDLRVRDVQEDAATTFRIPIDQLILYWKGRNICDTPNEFLETLGIENNHTMRVCRGDDPAQQNRQRELRSYATMDQQYSSSNDIYRQQQQQQQPYYPQYQQQVYSNYPTMYDQQQQQQYMASPRPNISGPVAASYVINLQIGFGDRVEGLVIGRPHPVTVYDLQVELQQRFNIPLLEQNVSYNGMSLTQFPPDISLDAIGIVNNSFVSLWYKNFVPQNQQLSNDYYSPRQQVQMPYSNDGSQTARSDMSSRRMDFNSSSGNETLPNASNQEVLKIEVFHGSDRHVLILRSANNVRIIDLMEELQRITTVPIQNQKLYYRGQELQIMRERSLRDVGIDNNAQVRLIGDPVKPRYEAMITGNRAN